MASSTKWILDGLESSGGMSFQCTDDLPVNRGLRTRGRGVREIGAMGMGLRQRQLETKGGDCIGTCKKNKDGDCVCDGHEILMSFPLNCHLLGFSCCRIILCAFPAVVSTLMKTCTTNFLDPCKLPPIPAPTTPKSKSKNCKCSGRKTELDFIWDGEGQVQVEGQDTIPENG